MTTLEKQISIAEMLKIEITQPYPPNKEQHGYLFKLEKDFAKAVGENYLNTSILKFDSDANWQFEALLFLSKNNYYWDILSYNSEEQGYECSIFIEPRLNIKIKSRGKSPQEAIFEALYQFSVYLKQKNESKNPKI